MSLAFGLSNVWTMEPSEYQTITSLEAINDAKKKIEPIMGLMADVLIVIRKEIKWMSSGNFALQWEINSHS